MLLLHAIGAIGQADSGRFEASMAMPRQIADPES
jgi:hypothetical protein